MVMGGTLAASRIAALIYSNFYANFSPGFLAAWRLFFVQNPQMCGFVFSVFDNDFSALPAGYSKMNSLPMPLTKEIFVGESEIPPKILFKATERNSAPGLSIHF